MTFEHKTGDRYLVTGFYYQSNRRFRIETATPEYALGINLWKGNVWQLRNGKRKLVKSVIN